MKKTDRIRTALCAVCALLLALLCSSCGSVTQTAVPYETELPAEVTVLEVLTVPEAEPTEPDTQATTEPTTETTTEETTEETKEATSEPTTEETTEAPTETPIERSAPVQESDVQDYVVNTNTRKFHYPSCSSAGDIKPKNRSDRTCTRDELISEGYIPCKRCNP